MRDYYPEFICEECTDRLPLDVEYQIMNSCFYGTCAICLSVRLLTTLLPYKEDGFLDDILPHKNEIYFPEDDYD